MTRSRSTMESVELTAVLDTLDDTGTRVVIKRLEEPMTTGEISNTCDIPLSTAYRKLDLLADAALLSEGTQIRADGHHTTTYEAAFDEVRIALNDEHDFDVAIGHPEQAPDERPADIWSRVRRET